MPAIRHAFIDEVLKAIPADIAELKEPITSIAPTPRAVRSHLAGLVARERRRDVDLATRRAGGERIERRLEVQD